MAISKFTRALHHKHLNAFYFRRCATNVEANDEGWSFRIATPPKASKRSFLRTKHGVTWDDPYYWLSNAEDPEVRKFLEEENEYARIVMKGTKNLQKQLISEMAGRMEKELCSPPERWGEWLYYTCIPEGKEFAVYYRRKAVIKEVIPQWKIFLHWKTKLKQDEVLIDINQVAEEHGYAHVGMCKLSSDHRLLAYTVDLTGHEVFTLFVKDLETGRILPEHVLKGVVSIEWSKTGHQLFYTTCNSLRRPFRLFSRNLKSQEGDILVFEELNQKRFVDVTRTKDWQYIVLNVNSKTSSEIFLVNPNLTLQRVEKRRSGIQYFMEHHCGFFYILTNGGDMNSQQAEAHQNYRLVRCKSDELCSKYWQEIVPSSHDTWIEDMDMFEKHLVLYKREAGYPCVVVMDFSTSMQLQQTKEFPVWTVPLPPFTSVVMPGANNDFQSATLRLNISSLTMPEATVDVNLSSQKLEVLQQLQLIQQKYDTGSMGHLGYKSYTKNDGLNLVDMSDAYSCEHVLPVSCDGVQIPMTLLYSSNIKRDGRNPALLIGYGAYGENLDMSFSSDRLSLLNRGWVLAFAHVRGGGMLGRPWHCSGKMLQKKNSFYDFISCAEFLANNRYAGSRKIAAWGESAGGLLVAAAVNLRPDLFQAVILKVPFLDVCNTMLDSGLSLTEHEYDEWGNPSEADVFHYIRSYSPYDNIISGGTYPGMFVTASFMDTRVGFWEAAKWVAKVRDCTIGCASRLLLLKTSMCGGHFGEGGRYEHLRDTASCYAFLLQNMEQTLVQGNL